MLLKGLPVLSSRAGQTQALPDGESKPLKKKWESVSCPLDPELSLGVRREILEGRQRSFPQFMEALHGDNWRLPEYYPSHFLRVIFPKPERDPVTPSLSSPFQISQTHFSAYKVQSLLFPASASSTHRLPLIHPLPPILHLDWDPFLCPRPISSSTREHLHMLNLHLDLCCLHNLITAPLVFGSP